eukprot:1312839-Rhodomonas_salina.2
MDRCFRYCRRVYRAALSHTRSMAFRYCCRVSCYATFGTGVRLSCYVFATQCPSPDYVMSLSSACPEAFQVPESRTHNEKPRSWYKLDGEYGKIKYQRRLTEQKRRHQFA